MSCIKTKIFDIKSKDQGQMAALEKTIQKESMNKIVWASNIPTLYKITMKLLRYVQNFGP